MQLLLGICEWSWKFLLSIFLTVTGLFIVPVALLFRKEDRTTTKAFSKHPTQYWTRINLPRIFWPWDNERDGAMGDTRGDYWVGKYRPKWNNRYWKMFWWLAVRNPHNNEDRWGVLGYDVTKVRVWRLSYTENISILVAESRNGGTCRALDWKGVLWIGNKIQLKHNTTDYQNQIRVDPRRGMKGFTIRLGGY